MTRVAEKRYSFTEAEVTRARGQFGQRGDPLSDLYRQKANYTLDKPRLAEARVQVMLENPAGEFDAEGRPKHPITAKIWEVIQLAAKNYQPIRLKDWQASQQGGFLCGAGEVSSDPEDPKGKK
ncbi:MAG: hypothetical protein K8G79_04670 [bacterium]|uniref:Uncharacterized protein n=1 Tax=Candidatus Methylomirabilis tolerans TaxID=3123416 RepID=A0AAJ1EJ14_9BACT|nr:hypothetical protein [Candidatus Methylomirabilis sp.]